MGAQSKHWWMAYCGSWVVAFATMTGIAALVFVEGVDQGASDLWWVLGAGAGAALGMFLARTTRSSGATHRALRWVGVLIVLGGVVGAGAMFVPAQEERGLLLVRGIAAVMAMGWLMLAGVGACFWLAGFSGKQLVRCAAASRTADGAPLA